MPSRVLNIGSINIDHVYRVERFVRPGETLPTLNYRTFAGGKGFNQSIALARAGVQVSHAGVIGSDGLWLQERLTSEGVDVSLLEVRDDVATGHAIIQVAHDGQNSILIHSGANHCVDDGFVDRVLDLAPSFDLVLVQNEVPGTARLVQLAGECDTPLAFNPAPMSDEIAESALDGLKLLVVNEWEAAALVGTGDRQAALDRLSSQWPDTICVLTCGSQGASVALGNDHYHVSAPTVDVVDTTAAGDTFVGYFVAEFLRTESIERALLTANRAASLTVTRAGAADSIPLATELTAD